MIADGADIFGEVAFERGAAFRQVQVTVDAAKLVIWSSLVKATFAVVATSMPSAESSTICAWGQVTEPIPRRTIP